MADPKAAGVDEAEWAKATASCVPLRLREVVRETADACSLVFEIPESLAERFAYRPGQFLSFRFAYEGKVLVRSYPAARRWATSRRRSRTWR